MGLLELILIAVGLAMDAFAVSVCKGLSMKKMDIKKALIIGLYFGGFQGGMPLLGYLLGVGFQEKIQAVDHWIAFGLLVFIGINMIKEALSKDEEDECNDKVDFKTMIVLAIATSIDALAIGVTFAFLKVNIMSDHAFEKSFPKVKFLLVSGAVTDAPSKHGSTSSPKIHNFENIASFIMKKSIPVL